MSHPIGVFIDSDLDLDHMAAEVEAIFGFKFHSDHDEHERWYEFHGQGWIKPNLISLGEHEFFNTQTLNLKDYRYYLRISEYRKGTPEEWQKEHQELAWHIFNKLKDSGKYPLMLVDNLESKWAEHKPEVRPEKLG